MLVLFAELTSCEASQATKHSRRWLPLLNLLLLPDGVPSASGRRLAAYADMPSRAAVAASRTAASRNGSPEPVEPLSDTPVLANAPLGYILVIAGSLWARQEQVCG